MVPCVSPIRAHKTPAAHDCATASCTLVGAWVASTWGWHLLCWRMLLVFSSSWTDNVVLLLTCVAIRSLTLCAEEVVDALITERHSRTVSGASGREGGWVGVRGGIELRTYVSVFVARTNLNLHWSGVVDGRANQTHHDGHRRQTKNNKLPTRAQEDNSSIRRGETRGEEKVVQCERVGDEVASGQPPPHRHIDSRCKHQSGISVGNL